MYIPMSDEVDVGALRETAVNDGKAVYVPVADDEDPSGWSFRRWHEGARLRRGYGRVWEPASGESPREVQSLCLVPGRVFTRNGQRLGRGSGCYDRLMPRLEGLGATVGVAYECQLADRIPVEAFDQPVQYLATEDGLFDCSTARPVHA